MLNFNIQGRSCHAEPFASLRVNSAKHLSAHRERPFASLRVTSEGSGDWAVFPVLVVKTHHRAGVGGGIPGEAVPLPSAINVAAYAPSRDAYWATARATELERLARGEPNALSRDAYWAILAVVLARHKLVF